MLFWALLAAGQITMGKVDGWQTLTRKLANQPVDIQYPRSSGDCACEIPAQIATAPANVVRLLFMALHIIRSNIVAARYDID